MRPAGYTLIELLVVIAIISILSVIGFVDFKSFAADQVAKKAVGEVQSVLRLAQSNATTSTFCGTESEVSWKIMFNVGGTSMDLACGPSNSLQRTYNLQNAQIQINGSVCGSSSALPITLSYASGTGALTFTATDNCLVNSPYLTFTITNTKDSGTTPKSFKLSKGGAIDIQQ